MSLTRALAERAAAWRFEGLGVDDLARLRLLLLDHLAVVVAGARTDSGETMRRFAGNLAAAAPPLPLFGTSEMAPAVPAAMVCGSLEFLEDGAWTKRLHPALAVRGGLEAALLARRGFRGTRDGLGGRHGFLTETFGDPKPERLLAGWGEAPLEVHNTAIKPHACCRYNQGPIDALLQIRREHGLRPSEIESVEVGLLTAAMDIVWHPAAYKRRPRSVVDAQFSLPFGAAVALVEGRAGMAEHAEQRLADPDLERIMDRVVGVADPGLDRAYPDRWGAWARVRTTVGRTLEARLDDPKGDPRNPLSPEELRAKFDDLTSPIFPAERRERIVGLVDRIDRPGTLDALLGTLAVAARATD